MVNSRSCQILVSRQYLSYRRMFLRSLKSFDYTPVVRPNLKFSLSLKPEINLVAGWCISRTTILHVFSFILTWNHFRSVSSTLARHPTRIGKTLTLTTQEVGCESVTRFLVLKKNLSCNGLIQAVDLTVIFLEVYSDDGRKRILVMTQA